MAKELTDDSASFPASVTCPEPGDPRTAASVEAGLQDLANRTANLKSGSVTFSGQKIFSSNVGIQGQFQCVGTSLFNSDLDIDAGATISGDLEIEATGNLYCNGSAAFSDSLSVTATGSLVVNSSATITAPQYNLTSTYTALRQSTHAIYSTTEWAVQINSPADRIVYVGQQVLKKIFFPFVLPKGAEVTGFAVSLNGAAGDIDAPPDAAYAEYGYYQNNLSFESEWNQLALDTNTATGAAWRTAHQIGLSGMSDPSLIVASGRQYGILVTHSGGAGAISGMRVHYAAVTFQHDEVWTGE